MFAVRCLGVALVCALAWASPASAETLAEAIAFAYQTNPTLQGARAQLRAVDEGYVQARSAYGPTVQVEATATYNRDRLSDTFSGATPLPSATDRANLGSARVIIDQPLYSGGRTTLGVNQAAERIRAARETLRASEQNIVFGVIQAYVDLRRDEQAVVIRQQNLETLTAQLRETRARAVAGEVTQTDVAQAEAQVHAEEANVASAGNEVLASKAAYTTVVGHNPGTLAPEPPLYGVPSTSVKAFEIAGTSSPEFLEALLTEKVSRTGIQLARAAGNPTISLRGTYGYSATLSPLNDRNRDRALTGQAVVSVPIFQSGRVNSQIRQAREVNTSDRLSIEAARRLMVQNIADSWNQAITASANIGREDSQIRAAALAYKGMRIEYLAGERSTLDVLIAEETLRDAELARLAAEHDRYTAQALVLRYIGRLDARDLVEAIPPYDAAAYLRKVEHNRALPWEALFKLLDGTLILNAGQRSIPAPEEAGKVAIPIAATQVAEGIIATFPTVAVPGTVSHISNPPIELPTPK